MGEVLARYEKVAGTFSDRLAGVRADQWDVVTPCSEWDVRAVVGHVITTHRRVASMVTGAPPGEPHPRGDLAAQWASAWSLIAAQLDEPEHAGKVIKSMFGEQAFESLVGSLLCADTLFHTWDLARATGQLEALDADAVARALEFLEPLDEVLRVPGGFGPKLTPPPGADVQAQFLCFGGRAAG